MRGWFKRAFSLLVVTAVMGSPAFAAPSPKAPPTVAIIVDVQRILDESDAAKGVQKVLNAQRAKFQNETEKEENELRTAEQNLSKAHDHLSADAYSEREQQLRQRFNTVENRVDARRKALDESFTNSMNVVRDNLLIIVQSVARDKGANMALVKQQILWEDQALDVTDQVLAELNKSLPQVDVKMPPTDTTETK